MLQYSTVTTSTLLPPRADLRRRSAGPALPELPSVGDAADLIRRGAQAVRLWHVLDTRCYVMAHV